MKKLQFRVMSQCQQSCCNITTVMSQGRNCHITPSRLRCLNVSTVMLLCYNCYVKKYHIITAVSQSQHCHVTNDIAIMSQCYHYFVKMSPLSDHNVTTVWPEYHHCHASLSLFNVMLYHKVSITMSPRPRQNEFNTVMSQCCPCTVMSHCLYCQVTLLMSQCYHCHVQMSTLSPLSCPNVNTFTTVMSKCQHFHHRHVQMSTLSPLSCPNVNTFTIVMSKCQHFHHCHVQMSTLSTLSCPVATTPTNTFVILCSVCCVMIMEMCRHLASHVPESSYIQ